MTIHSFLKALQKKESFRSAASAMVAFTNLSLTQLKQTARQTLAVFTMLAFTVACFAQDQAPPPLDKPNTPSANAPAPDANVTIPAGTRLALVLTNPVSSKNVRRGDTVYAQTNAPVTVGDRVVIPAGVFVQGKVEKLSRNGTRAEMLMQSASVIYPDGYAAQITGPINVESEEGTAWRDPGNAAKTGAIIAPLAGLGIGAAIGSAAHTTQSSSLGGTTLTSSTPKGLAIGSLAGLAVGSVISIALLLHSRQFFVDVGSPMQMTLPQPVTMSEGRVENAVREAQEHPVPLPVAAPRPVILAPTNTDHGTCYTAEIPGTPPTIIPGTPPIGDSPGTPDTIIPGTPPIPGTPYPCP